MSSPMVAQVPKHAVVPEGGPTIASVDKALRVIEYMASLGPQGAALNELAEALGINKSSLHHTLGALRRRHWVEQDANGRYQLGSATALVVHWWTNSDQISHVVHPVLQRICSASHELVHLGRLSDASVLYLDKVEPERAVRVWSQIGKRAPAATTSMGRAILGASELDWKDLRNWLDVVENPGQDLEKRFAEEIERVRTSGYAVEIEENEPGIACVGVPISFAASLVASISITLPIERCSSTRLDELAHVIIDTVRTAEIRGVSVIEPVADGLAASKA